MFDLFVGDVGEYLSYIAKSHDQSAILVNYHTINEFLNHPTSTAYTSVGDIEDLKTFMDFCLKARSIFFCPPPKWAAHPECKDKIWTESILSHVGQYVPVHNLTLKNNTNKFLVDFSNLKDSRKTDSKQLWAVGCSITHGDGLKEHETWKHLVSSQLNLEYSSLTQSSSSIIWQANQICQSDIRSGDLVFWGQTSHQRLPVINEQTASLVHLQQTLYQQQPKLANQFPPDILLSSSLVYHNVMAVKNVYNFCKKAGAELVILGLMYDWDLIYKFYDVPVYRQYITWPMEYVDIASDNIHPGPEQHKLFAKEFVEFYNYLYNT